MVSVGIVGLPNVGKSTLFNALLKKRVALSANYPFATVEPNVGVVAVPDERLEKLAELVAREEGMIPQEILKQIQDDTLGVEAQKSEVLKKPPIVPAVVEFVDIAGLVKGASTGAGLGNQFLSHIREVDAVIHVLRDFSDPSIIREGSISPDEDRLTIETELGLADLQVIEKLIDGQDKQIRATHDSLDQKKHQILNSIKEKLESGEIRDVGDFGEVSDERIREWFKALPLLTIKPVLYVFNVSESGYAEKLRDSSLVAQNDKSGVQYDSSLIICAKLEEELADLSEEERNEYLKEMRIEETGLERLIKKAYTLLGLISFLTAGKKEVRAWTLRRGETALRASGVIHTDFMKKFIRAEIIEYQKLIEAGSIKTAKDKGWIRTEGRDYIMRDGDVVEFLIGS